MRRHWRLNDRVVGLAGSIGLLLSAATFELLEAELVVFLHLPHLLLHLQQLEVQLFDRAVELADLLLERGHARVARLGELDRALVALAAENARQADLGDFNAQPGTVARMR